MNDIAAQPDRQARSDLRLRRCARLAEMALELAELTNTQAQRDAQPPPEHPRPAPRRPHPKPENPGTRAPRILLSRRTSHHTNAGATRKPG